MSNTVKKLQTVDDWLKKGVNSNEQIDLIDGEIYAQASPTGKHSWIQAKLSHKLLSINDLNLNKKKQPPKWIILTEAGIFYDNKNVFTHDLAGWKLEKHEKIVEKEILEKSPIHIKPDWVCEILSTNWKTDIYTKFNVLQQQGVEYYWTIDIKNNIINVFKYLKELRTYEVKLTVSVDKQDIYLPPFEGVLFDVKNFFESLV